MSEETGVWTLTICIKLFTHSGLNHRLNINIDNHSRYKLFTHSGPDHRLNINNPFRYKLFTHSGLDHRLNINIDTHSKYQLFTMK